MAMSNFLLTYFTEPGITNNARIRFFDKLLTIVIIRNNAVDGRPLGPTFSILEESNESKCDKQSIEKSDQNNVGWDL